MAVLAAAPGSLARNVVVFARVLRASGLPVGPDRAIAAVRAAAAHTRSSASRWKNCSPINSRCANCVSRRRTFRRRFSRDPSRCASSCWQRSASP
jgi:uncharacterized protein with von Willebrand factor type A (vWA) domain